MWPSTLSGRLPVVAMVGLHPAIQLMGRGPVPRRPRRAFPGRRSRSRRLMRYYPRFPTAIPRRGVGCPRVTHPSAALGPEGPPARLACLRRAASVRSEPGSNSPSLHSSTEVLAQLLESSGQDPPELNRLADIFQPQSRSSGIDSVSLPFLREDPALFPCFLLSSPALLSPKKH